MITPVDLLHAMLDIPSPSGREDELARFLEKTMNDLGMAAYRDEAGNVIGDIGTGRGPVVMLLSHLDTVDRPLPARRDGDRLVGRGAADAKGPLAAMISAAAARPTFPGTIRVAGAVEEERLSRGGEHLARTVAPPDALLVGEPSGWSRVVLGYKGKIDIGYRVTRPATHSTNPVPKATEVAAGFWRDLLDELGPEAGHGAGHGAFGAPAATLRGVRGDLTEAVLDIDCRVPPGFDVDDLVARLRACANGGEITVVRYIPAVRRDRSDPVVRAVTTAIRRHGGRPRPTLKTGTSDMNTVAPHWNVPMATYGPGDSSLDHADDEHIEVGEYLRGVDVLTATLDELAAAL